MKYSYLIVGSGLFGATMAYSLNQRGYKCLVIDKRPHIGGNASNNRASVEFNKQNSHEE